MPAKKPVKAPQEKVLKEFKVTSKPEGDLTTVNDRGEVRSLLRQTVVVVATEKEARRYVDAQNWDAHVMNDEPLYEIVNVEIF